MTPEGEKLLADLVEKERTDQERKAQAYIDGEQHLCQGCSYRWSFENKKYRTRPRPPIWIEAAQGYWHLRCWQAHCERKTP